MGGQTSLPSAGLRTVLVVDDDDGVRGLLRDILSDAGYGVLCAANGQEALDRLGMILPDLIISDCRMPVMDGTQLFRHVKSDLRMRHIPYVVVTAAIDQKTKESLFEGFVDAFILKPFDNERVLRTVGQFLRTIRVLVVDDDASIRDLVRLALAGQGFDVATASDGRDALERLREQTADVIFADMDMPRLDGPGLVRALRGLEPGGSDELFGLPILLTSGSETAETLAPDLRGQIDGFLPKPYDMDELGVMIRLAVGRRGL